MDVFIIMFVAGLCTLAFFVTMTVRREFRTQERQRRAQEQTLRNPRRKP